MAGLCQSNRQVTTLLALTFQVVAGCGQMPLAKIFHSFIELNLTGARKKGGDAK